MYWNAKNLHWFGQYLHKNCIWVLQELLESERQQKVFLEGYPSHNSLKSTFFPFRGEDINMEIKINLSHGAENSADMTLKGEITEAVSTFLSKRFAETLNANMEFCTEGKKCKKMKICDGDLCNSI